MQRNKETNVKVHVVFTACMGTVYRMAEITGGSPYGAGTLAGGDGSRQPSENELRIARFQGAHVAQLALRLRG